MKGKHRFRDPKLIKHKENVGFGAKTGAQNNETLKKCRFRTQKPGNIKEMQGKHRFRRQKPIKREENIGFGAQNQ